MKAGISRDRLILDPGMGFFLSTNPAASLNVLANSRGSNQNSPSPFTSPFRENPS